MGGYHILVRRFLLTEALPGLQSRDLTRTYRHPAQEVLVFTISADQMSSLTELRKAAFLGRLCTFIEEQTHRTPDESSLDDFFVRGSTYGLSSEREFAGYIAMAWMSGVIPPAPDHEWIASIMRDPYRLPEDKVKALFDVANLKLGERT
jgi:hypothetical protein